MNDENQTGYGPGGKNGKGNWILDFAGAAKRTSSGADPNVPTRYKDETVNISLALPGAKGKGRKVIRGQAPRLGN